MILFDTLNEAWQDPLSFCRKRILHSFRKILRRILNDLDEILATETIRIANRILIKSYTDLVE